ncbi:MAG: flavin monoamine oxidase family protein [Mesorhizobium sp.]|nr:flavin monoamine oxidase family protein [Mesorhizobium sp.]MBL8577574.1 flavin monoamine oxidase family protein [Mesorhizobium sp.]
MAKIVVIGAGFCGLSAALALRQAGVDVTVLEARGRVGGRVEAQPNGLGEIVDTGGQFICDDMPEVMKLARRNGATLVESDFTGNYVTQPQTSLEQAERARSGSTALRERMSALPPDDPSLSGLTVAGWLARQDESEDVKAAFRTMIEGLWCVSLEIMPAWYLIDNDRRITNEVGELQYSLAGTMQALADQLAEELGASIRLSEPAIRIEHGSSGVRVLTDKAAYEADAALVAVPPMTARRIDYEPALSLRLSKALGAWQSGAVIKVLARYAKPFWREKGVSGMVMWREPSGLFAFDSSRDINHPQLTFFVGGPLATEWTRYGEQAIRDAAKAKLVTALGPEAADPLDMTVRDWTGDRWSGGAYSDVIVDMAARDAESVIRTGAPPLFFASSELSPSFPGYVEGAIVSGRQVAARIVSALG